MITQFLHIHFKGAEGLTIPEAPAYEGSGFDILLAVQIVMGWETWIHKNP